MSLFGKMGLAKEQEFTETLLQLSAADQLVVGPEPSAVECAAWEEITHAKDCHVLAAAWDGECDYLVALDKNHLLTPKVIAGFPLPAYSPAEFLSRVADIARLY